LTTEDKYNYLHAQFFFGLNIALVPANMIRLSFGPCKKKNQKSVPAKNSVF